MTGLSAANLLTVAWLAFVAAGVAVIHWSNRRPNGGLSRKQLRIVRDYTRRNRP